MTELNRPRVERMIALLEKIEQDETPFDINDWVTRGRNADGHPCGTAACAMGWAALDPWFQKQGLVLFCWLNVYDEDIKGSVVHRVKARSLEHLDSLYKKGCTRVRPVYVGELSQQDNLDEELTESEEYPSVDFFGMPESDYNNIFYPKAYMTEDERHDLTHGCLVRAEVKPRQVIERLQALLDP